MEKYSKTSFGAREKITHRILYYINNRTSPKKQEWRNVTIQFFFDLFEIMNENPSLNIFFHRADGMKIYSGSKPVVFLQIYQQHFLIHAGEEYLMLKDGDGIFKSEHKGSFLKMWKTTCADEVNDFKKYLSKLTLPSEENNTQKASRTIPTWVQELIYERDGGKCVACNSRINLCFDHILPFSKGGSSEHPNNIQILCGKCNLEKSANFWPIKI